jgi:hypothetical protein
MPPAEHHEKGHRLDAAGGERADHDHAGAGEKPATLVVTEVTVVSRTLAAVGAPAGADGRRARLRNPGMDHSTSRRTPNCPVTPARTGRSSLRGPDLAGLEP